MIKQQLPANATSPASRSALPDAWIESVFQKFEDFYGARWAALYGDFPRARVMATWAEELSGFTPDALRYGFDAVKGNRFPPTLPEFIEACRRAPRPRRPALDAPPIPQEKLNARLAEIGKFCRDFGKRPSQTEESSGVA